MSACRRLRPALLRVADGDATPAESLRVARHVASCTTCRIVAHRERRLRSVLDGLEDAPADVAFLDRVMEALPSTPPPPPIGAEAQRIEWLRRRRSRLLGITVLVAGTGAAAAHAAGFGFGGGFPGLPQLSQLAESGSALGALVMALLTTAGSVAPGVFEPPHLAVPAVVAASATLAIAGALTLGAAAVLSIRRAIG